MPSVSNSRYACIDVAKLVAALLVVSIHTEPCQGLAHVVLIDILARMAVPFFFVASAFFFFRKPVSERRVSHYVKRMAVLYAFWFIVESPITFLHFFLEQGGSLPEKMMLLFRSFLLGSTFSGSWFLMALLISIPFLHLLSRCSVWFSLAIGTVSYVSVSLASFHLYQLSPVFRSLAFHYEAVFGRPEFSFLVALLPCAIGRLLAEKEDAVLRIPCKVWAGFMVASVLLLALEVFGQYRWTEVAGLAFDRTDASLVLPFCVGIAFALLLKTRLHFTCDFKLLRTSSTLIYFSHFIFVFLCVVVNKHLFPISPLLKFVVTLLSCSIFIRIVLVLEQKPGFRWLRYAH